MRVIGLLSALVVLAVISICFADSPAPPNSVSPLGTWEKTYSNGDTLSLTFKSNNAVEIKYPTGKGDHDITMWKLKGDTVLLFSSSGDLKGRMDSNGKLLIVGPTFGKPLFDLVLVKKD